MDYELLQAGQQYLASGERLLWSGQPKPGLRFRPSDAVAIPFSLLWGGFAVFWEYSVIQSGGPFFFELWGIPFVAMGLYITVGRFFYDALLRGSTLYLLTDQRVVIVSGVWSRSINSLPLQSLGDYDLSEGSDGSGTITLGAPRSGFGFRFAGWPGSRRYAPPALEMIENVRTVYGQLRDAIAKRIPPQG